MAELERLLQRLEVDASNFNAGLQAARGELVRTDQSTGRATRTMSDRFNAVGRSVLNLRSLIGTLAGAAAVRQVIGYADAWTRAQGRLRLATDSSEELARATDQLFGVAQRTAQSFETTIDLYARLERSTRNLEVADADLLAVTEAVNQSVRISGASAESALMQFSMN